MELWGGLNLEVGLILSAEWAPPKNHKSNSNLSVLLQHRHPVKIHQMQMMMQINKTWKINLPLYSISFQNELSFQMLWSPEACAASWVASTLPAPSGSLGMYPLLDLSLGSAPLQRTCALSGVFPCACRIWNLLPVLPTVHLTQTATARKKSRGSPSAVPSHPFKQSKK